MALITRLKRIYILSLLPVIFLTACNKNTDDPEPPQDIYDPTPYTLIIPQGFPDMDIPTDNPMTVEGVELGRRLFYDPILSADNTQALYVTPCEPIKFVFVLAVIYIFVYPSVPPIHN